MTAAHADPPDDAVRRIAVVGGGISGLAAARWLAETSDPRQQVVLFEASDRLGGAIETSEVDGYLVEAGPDAFITDKPRAIELCRALGLDDRLVDTESRYRRSLVVRRGRPRAVPAGFALMGPARMWPVLTSGLFSLSGRFRIALEPFMARRRESGDESVAAFVRRRLGAEALDRLVQPLVAGIYTSDLERLSLAATLPRFIELERKYGSLWRGLKRQPANGGEVQGARYGLFASLAGGLRELVSALHDQLAGSVDLRTRTPVESIEGLVSRPGYRLRLRNGQYEEVGGVVLAVPAFVASHLLRSLDSELAARLDEIAYASSVIVVSGHSLDDITHPLDAFGLVVPRVEDRQVLAVSFASRKLAGRAPGGKVLLRTFVGGALQPELVDREDDELRELVRRELSELLGVGGKPDFEIVCRHDRAMPQYEVGHLERVDEIERRIAVFPGLALAGNAYHGVGIPDCIAGGEHAAERVVGTPGET